MSLLNQFLGAEAREILKYVWPSLSGAFSNRNSVPSCSSPSFATYFKMVRGGTLSSSLVTILEQTLLRTRMCYQDLSHIFCLMGVRYQRLYFRNANHPIARPSVATRRQERTSVTARTRALEYGIDGEHERR